jgi:hypothetical protein
LLDIQERQKPQTGGIFFSFSVLGGKGIVLKSSVKIVCGELRHSCLFGRFIVSVFYAELLLVE